MTWLWVVVGIYVFNALLALFPAFFIVGLGGKNNEMWKVPVLALSWPWWLLVYGRYVWRTIKGREEP